MNVQGELISLKLDKLIADYEAARRAAGYGAGEAPMTISQRLEAERVLVAMPPPADETDREGHYLRYLKPVLAESRESQRLLEQVLRDAVVKERRAHEVDTVTDDLGKKQAATRKQLIEKLSGRDGSKSPKNWRYAARKWLSINRWMLTRGAAGLLIVLALAGASWFLLPPALKCLRTEGCADREAQAFCKRWLPAVCGDTPGGEERSKSKKPPENDQIPDLDKTLISRSPPTVEGEIVERAMAAVRHSLSVALIATARREQQSAGQAPAPGRAEVPLGPGQNQPSGAAAPQAGDNGQTALPVSLTPRQHAAYQVASVPNGGTRPGSVDVMLVAMIVAMPHHPDKPYGRTREGLAVLRRHAGEAAAMISGVSRMAIAPMALGIETIPLPDDARRMLAAYIVADAPQPMAPADAELAARWELLLLFAPAALAGLFFILTARRRRERERKALEMELRPEAERAFQAELRERRLNWSAKSLFRAAGRPIGRARGSAPLEQDFGIPRIPRDSLRRVARLRSLLSHRLDEKRSVAAVLRNAGYADPIFRETRKAVSYLVLVRRMGEHDHERLRVRRFLDALRETGVPMQVYDYYLDPMRLVDQTAIREPMSFNERDTIAGNRELRLESLADQHSHARLILITDGSELVEPVRLQVRSAVVKALRPWPQRMILTPRPPGEWGGIEFAISRDLQASIGRTTTGALRDVGRGFPGEGEARPWRRALELAGTETGRIKRVAAWVEEAVNGAEPSARFGSDRWLRRGVRTVFDDPRFDDDLSPDDAFIEAAIADLRDWLGPDAFRWHASLACFPDIRPDLTMHFGKQLQGASGAPIFEPGLAAAEARFERLTVLPWFRDGRWPEWLREQLLGRLDSEDRRIAWKILADLFNENEDNLQKPPSETDTRALKVWWPMAGGIMIPEDDITMQLAGSDDSEMPAGKAYTEVLNGLVDGAIRRRMRQVRIRQLAAVASIAAWGGAFFWLWPGHDTPEVYAGDWLGVALLAFCAAGLFVITGLTLALPVIGRLNPTHGVQLVSNSGAKSASVVNSAHANQAQPRTLW